MIRATVARGLRMLASLVAGDDPAALALEEAVRAGAAAKQALEAAQRADATAVVADEMALRTRGVVAALLREGVGAAMERGARESRPVERWPLPTLTVARARELLRELAHPGDEEG